MAKHDFISGVTDAGKPRAAKGGFPYPGHGTLEDQRIAKEKKRWSMRAQYERERKSWRTT